MSLIVDLFNKLPGGWSVIKFIAADCIGYELCDDAGEILYRMEHPELEEFANGALSYYDSHVIPYLAKQKELEECEERVDQLQKEIKDLVDSREVFARTSQSGDW